MNIRKLFVLLMPILLLMIYLYGQAVVAQSDTSVYTTDIDWSRDGNLVAVVGIQPPTDNANSRGYISVYDVNTGSTIYHAMTDYGGYASVTWGPDNRFLAIGSYDQTIKVVDLERQEIIVTLTGHRATVSSVDWIPDGNTLVSTGVTDQQVILWDMSSYEQISVLEIGDPWVAAFSPDGTRIAVGGVAGLYVVPSDLSVSQNFSLNQFRLADGYIGGLAWSEDGNQIAFGTQVFANVVNPEAQVSAQLTVVDANAGTELHTVETSMESIFGVSLSGRLLSAHSLNGLVQVWNLENNTLVDTVTGVNRYASNVRFSPYGGRLAYGTIVDLVESDPASAGWTGTLGVETFVPAPSLDRLTAIAELCVRDATAPAESLTTLTARPIAEDMLPDFVSQIEALPENTIPPACAADLIAVAEAIQSR